MQISWLIALAVPAVTAHMQLTFPLPLESSLDARNANPDYSMTSPLAMDGSNFPCKGYLASADAHVTATFHAGQDANFTLAGSATHGGGSCQIALSYDRGKTFKVIESILGGCPLQTTYDFAFPAALPGGNSVVFSWSWMNKVGNREFYQNCALVDIIGSGSQSFLAALPDMQVANVGRGCTSVEGTEVIYTNPGVNVQYGGSYAAGASAVNGQFGAGLTGTCGASTGQLLSTIAVSPVGAASKSSPSSSSAVAAAVVVAAPTSHTTAPAAAQTTSSSSQGGSCANGAIICTGTGYTWSTCVNGAPVAMGAVAPGTVCRNARMVYDTPVAGNVAGPATTTLLARPGFKVIPSSTTSTSRLAATTNSAASPACFSKREMQVLAAAECQDFALTCGADGKSFRICSSGVWEALKSLSAGEVCMDDRIRKAAYAPTKQQYRMEQRAPACTGTGVVCAADGKHYQLCTSETHAPVPNGMRCIPSQAGGVFVSWYLE